MEAIDAGDARVAERIFEGHREDELDESDESDFSESDSEIEVLEFELESESESEVSDSAGEEGS